MVTYLSPLALLPQVTSFEDSLVVRAPREFLLSGLDMPTTFLVLFVFFRLLSATRPSFSDGLKRRVGQATGSEVCCGRMC